MSIMSCVDGSRVARICWCGVVVGCSLVSGLLLRCVEPLALMVSADRVPFCFADWCVLDVNRVVPIPGLTGLPSPLIVLAIVDRFVRCGRSVDHAAAFWFIDCGARYTSSRVITAQAIRAVLLAMATATSLAGFLCNRLAVQGCRSG